MQKNFENPSFSGQRLCRNGMQMVHQWFVHIYTLCTKVFLALVLTIILLTTTKSTTSSVDWPLNDVR